MNIHNKINFKEYYKGKIFHRDMNNKGKIDVNYIKDDVKDYAINYSIYLYNKNQQNKMINSGLSYCHDCSYDYNKRCEHYNYNPNYIKFINAKNSNLDLIIR